MPFLILLAAVALQVFLTAKKLSPFLSLLIVALVTGFLSGMSPAAILVAVEKGVGSTLGGLALILCLGAALGKVLEISGAAEQIAVTLIRAFGQKNIPWAVLITGFLVGLPLYYNAGFVILVPLIFTVARKTGLPLIYIAISTAAALSTTHCFLPPHPGPVVLVKAFQADMGKTLLYGLIMAVPAMIIAGPVLGKQLRRMKTSEPPAFNAPAATAQALPAVFPSFFIALLPVLLITTSVLISQFVAGEPLFKKIILFLGDPTIALLLTLLLAGWYLGLRRGYTMPTVMQWLNSAISGIAMILLIITAGGVLKQVLLDSHTGDYITAFASRLEMSPLVFAWLITALLRVCIGSATVAGITAAGVVSPLITTGQASPELMVLAVGAGSVFGSHINDSGFWMFKEYFGLSLRQTFLSWTLMESTISVLGLLSLLALQALL